MKHFITESVFTNNVETFKEKGHDCIHKLRCAHIIYSGRMPVHRMVSLIRDMVMNTITIKDPFTLRQNYQKNISMWALCFSKQSNIVVEYGLQW